MGDICQEIPSGSPSKKREEIVEDACRLGKSNLLASQNESFRRKLWLLQPSPHAAQMKNGVKFTSKKRMECFLE